MTFRIGPSLGFLGLLIEKANVDIADRYGRTPLSYAANTGCSNIVELLLKKADLINRIVWVVHHSHTPLDQEAAILQSSYFSRRPIPIYRIFTVEHHCHTQQKLETSMQFAYYSRKVILIPGITRAEHRFHMQHKEDIIEYPSYYMNKFRLILMTIYQQCHMR